MPSPTLFLRRTTRVLLLLLAPLATGMRLGAQQLPLRHWTAALGLAGDDIISLLQDTRGYLWVGTAAGLSRFDGEVFRTYDTRQGLPHPRVNAILEDRSGVLWVGTGGGLARFDPSPPETGHPFRPVTLDSGHHAVLALYLDHRGSLWVGGTEILFRGDPTPGGYHFQPVSLPLPGRLAPGAVWEINAITGDSAGSLWFATTNGLVRRRPDGRFANYRIRPGDDDDLRQLAFDDAGRLWITHWGTAQGPGVNWGLYVFRPPPAAAPARGASPFAGTPAAATPVSLFPPPAAGATVRYATGGALLGRARLHGAFGEGPGVMLLATESGVLRVSREGVVHLAAGSPLEHAPVHIVLRDRERNLWLGTRGEGLFELARHGFETFSGEDGLGGSEIMSVFQDNSGAVCASLLDTNGTLRIARLEHGRFLSLRPGGTAGVRNWGWGTHQTVLQDREGDWWVPTGEGLFRYRRPSAFTDLSQAHPMAVYRTSEGLARAEVFRLYQDRQGDLWISTFGNPGLDHWHRTSGRIEGVESVGRRTPTAFAEDSAGDVWMGFYLGGLARLRGGRLELFGAAEGVPPWAVSDLHVDARGRLWVSVAGGGLLRIEHPAAATPQVTLYTAESGLASNNVKAVTEDRWGRIYAATVRGVDRLDPASGAIRHFGTAQGLASSTVGAAFRDRSGGLWFASRQGLSRYEPGPPERSPAPPVRIAGIRAAGAPWPVAELGEDSVGGMRLSADAARVEITYEAVSLSEPIRYQTRLVGVDADWSRPTGLRSITYPNLAPGSYRFLVRAVTPEGETGGAEAAVRFTVVPPLWRRPWALALSFLLLAAAALAAHRYRLRRVLEMERVRTRIATDLHDDLGSRLARISILAEVAARQLGPERDETRRILGEVGATARGLIEATSDIAWSMDPRRNDVQSLVARVRQFAGDLLDSRGIAWTFDAPADAQTRHLSASQRRHLLLIVQEAVHNIVRHSRATRVTIRLRITRGRVELEIIDDGRGLPPEGDADARGGLRNMRARADDLGGQLEILSGAGGGIHLRVSVPLNRASGSLSVSSRET